MRSADDLRGDLRDEEYGGTQDNARSIAVVKMIAAALAHYGWRFGMSKPSPRQECECSSCAAQRRIEQGLGLDPVQPPPYFEDDYV